MPTTKRILANDGIDASGKQLLEKAGFFVETTKAPEGHLSEVINDGEFNVLLVRSATKVTAAVIDSCPGLKLIGRAGVGLDNIDLKHAEDKDVKVINTPAASSQSVAELVFAHLFSGVRFLQDSNHKMRTEGSTRFNELKKTYSAGIELKGKTIGVFGFGRIGQAVAKMGIGLGMKVLAYDPFIEEVNLDIHILQNNSDIKIKIKTVSKDRLLTESDFISMHVPGKINGMPVIGAAELKMMKKGAGIVNASRGGVIDEDALLYSLDNGKLAFAGLDVFEDEPTPRTDVLYHPKISVTPHIGASTAEAQERIGIEMAENIITFFSHA